MREEVALLLWCASRSHSGSGQRKTDRKGGERLAGGMDAWFLGVKQGVRHKADLAAASATVLFEPPEDPIDLHPILPSWPDVARRGRRLFVFHSSPLCRQGLHPSIYACESAL